MSMPIDKRQERMLTWAVFLAYTALLLMALSKHELWGDEIHSWNIARSSTGLLDLLNNSRFEGHPPLWYAVLFTITRFTHDPEYMKAVQAVFAMAAVFIVLFASPFPVVIRALIPFGYYFAFEYGAFSRNYAIALVLAFSTAWLLTQKPRHYRAWFFFLVFLLSCTHLLGLLLAISFCVYHAWQERAAEVGTRRALVQLALGAIICIPAALQIAPPGESQLNMQFWMDRWTVQQWDIMAQAPLKAFVPIPDADQFHFWNTNALLQLLPSGDNGLLIVRCTAIATIASVCLMLRKVRGSMGFFASNELLTAAVAFVFPLTSARYVGFIFIAFIIAAWFHAHERPLGRGAVAFTTLVLVLHVFAAALAIRRDYSQPFSHSSKVRELIAQVPSQANVVTDYWCLNNLSAFIARPFYCLEHRKELSFLRWDAELAKATSRPEFYTTGLLSFWQHEQPLEVYMISVKDPDGLRARDSALFNQFDLELINSWEGAIEPSSNVYLYKVRASALRE
ncbi:MAG: hypothetical protein WAT74_07825 [Flavobacteriales bacterium]